MKAMVLAAGLGTRLRPLTDDRPKALVTVGGRTLLEIVLARLRRFGVSEVIVNTHHYAEKIREYLAANRNFGMRIELSHEEELLDTGGGLKKAAWFFLDGKDPRDASLPPFLLHNVDILSTIDVARMIEFHRQQKALATIAVQDRETSRYLLFDQQGILSGRRSGKDGELRLARPAAAPSALAYSCIQVIAPRIFAEMTEEGAFSIIDAGLRLAAQGERVLAFRADGAYWRDLGRPEQVAQAERELPEWAIEK
jgi:NDP-sugar pyrophosphorylase family protein